MASVRLTAEQIERLRSSGNASAEIRYAVQRWKRGDFVIGRKPKKTKGKNLLQVFPIWRKIDGVKDWQLREILEKHWSTPDIVFQQERDREIAKWVRIIDEMMKCLPPIIIEGEMEL